MLKWIMKNWLFTTKLRGGKNMFELVFNFKQSDDQQKVINELVKGAK